MSDRQYIRHGKTDHPLYSIWTGMKYRCQNPKARKYVIYGGRGIKVCERWNDFANFLADMGERPAGMTIERIDNDGDYEPSNCRWATQKEQERNKSTNVKFLFQGKERCVAEIAELTGVPRYYIYARLRRGWPVERALTEPVAPRRRP